jgi:hypothetical protein
VVPGAGQSDDRPGGYPVRLILALGLVLVLASPVAAGESSTTLRDKNGFRVGRVDEDRRGNLTIRDKAGNRTGTWQHTGDGYIIRDRAGYRIGAVKR